MSWKHLIEFGVPPFIILLIVLIGRRIGNRHGDLGKEVDTKPGSGILGISETILRETFKSPRSVTKIRKR